jgi:multidrug efflux pump subunit AcrA (membrane-fusion protein)
VLRHDRPPTGTADTEAAALEVAAAAPPFDVPPQELAVHLAKEKDNAAATERQAAYDAALARLAQAKEEAANASKAHAAAIAHEDRERARATAALQPSTPVESSAGESASPGGGPADLHSALLLQEAAALLNLHAQAVTVNNIRSLIHIILDVDSNHFNRWRNQFLLVLSKFSLQAHVLAAPAPSPDWDRMDCVAKSWILDSLTEIISSQGTTARDAWLTVESQFLGNRETRAI